MYEYCKKSALHTTAVNRSTHVACGGKRASEFGATGVPNYFHLEIRFNLVNEGFNSFTSTIDTF